MENQEKTIDKTKAVVAITIGTIFAIAIAIAGHPHRRSKRTGYNHY